ncbi:hypothetical protein NC653_031583 [Populus alba x Populus x berolinensis]|uniref:Uncharacterized protein n=1 Tax=Populus alba x Populus x berolinensis TaxID=444605 RepID=A0AAD6LZ58_9ROSI|nr:hypothetical protein NC653_031583 [Populus alba x Populus x berolinensis]
MQFHARDTNIDKKKKKKKCGERGSNTRPSDLQSDALPTELSPQPLSHKCQMLIFIILFYKYS